MVFILFVLILGNLFLSPNPPDPGVFVMNHGRGSNLKIANNKFVLTVYNCTYQFKVKGNLSLNHDTLKLIGETFYKAGAVNSFKKVKSKSSFITSKFKIYSQFLIRGNDSLLSIYKSQSGKFYTSRMWYRKPTQKKSRPIKSRL